jgi:hypothetical protein
MSDQDEQSGWKTSARGESAWKEAREAVATRNRHARDAGKVEREAYTEKREAARAVAERRRAKEVTRRGR